MSLVSLGWQAIFKRTRLVSCLGLSLVLPKGIFAFFPLSNLHSHPSLLQRSKRGGLLEVACSPVAGLGKLKELFPAPNSQ